MNRIFTLFVILFLIAGCKKKETPVQEEEIQYGKIIDTTMVDGIQREYIVSVPPGYDGKSATPVVFMLHGTGGDGERFYNHSGWKEVGDQENILTVYPSSLSNCILDEGVQKITTKWNSQPDRFWTYCPSVTPPDDVKFLSQVIDELVAKYKVDSKRIYFVGFSNGGQMCAKLSIQLGNRIAAIVESAAAFGTDTVYTPVRKMPVTFQMGNGDYGPGITGPFLPLSSLDTLLRIPNHQPYIISQTYIRSFNLNPNFTISGDTNTAVIATYIPNDGNTTNNFNFVFIKDLTHQYPNGINHWLNAAQANWKWLKQFKLP